jgi:hypothetical protein
MQNFMPANEYSWPGPKLYTRAIKEPAPGPPTYIYVTAPTNRQLCWRCVSEIDF